MERIPPLQEPCRTELAGVLGIQNAAAVANLFDALLVYADSMDAKVRAAEMLAGFMACIEQYPMIEASLTSLPEWGEWKASAPLVLQRIQHREPIEITVIDLQAMDRPLDESRTRPIAHAKTRRTGRRSDERRKTIGVVLATAFRFAHLIPTRGALGDFAKAYTVVCRHLGMFPPSEWKKPHLGECVRLSGRLWAEIKRLPTDLAREAQQEQVLRDTRLAKRRRVVRKVGR